MDNLETWPERIWLQHGDEDGIPDFQQSWEHVTWCQDSVEQHNVAYVRADRLEQLQQRIAELEAPGVPSELNELLREAEALSPAGSLAMQKVRSARALLSAVDAQKVRDEALEEAPANSLPTWDECAIRVDNSDFIAKRVAEGGYGAEHDTMLANELHRFIYEYDDADPYHSAWFMHRLELVLKECAEESIRSIQSQPASAGKDAEEKEKP